MSDLRANVLKPAIVSGQVLTVADAMAYLAVHGFKVGRGQAYDAWRKGRIKLREEDGVAPTSPTYENGWKADNLAPLNERTYSRKSPILQAITRIGNVAKDLAIDEDDPGATSVQRMLAKQAAVIVLQTEMMKDLASDITPSTIDDFV